jgi:hypothetical protein
LSQHVAGSRLTSNIKIGLKITFTSEIFADVTRSLAVVLLHLKFSKKILILTFFIDLFSVKCKFFCPNSAENTMENRAISLVESSRDNSLIACPTSSVPTIRIPWIRGFLFSWSCSLQSGGAGQIGNPLGAMCWLIDFAEPIRCLGSDFLFIFLFIYLIRLVHITVAGNPQQRLPITAGPNK